MAFVVEREPRQVQVLVEVFPVVEEDKVAVLFLHRGDGRLDEVEGVGLFAPVIGLAEPVGGLGHGPRCLGGYRLCGDRRLALSPRGRVQKLKSEALPAEIRKAVHRS